MAKSKSFIGEHTALSIVAIIIVSFVAGFVLARTKYKPQLQTTYNMVMDREQMISTLKTEMNRLQMKVASEAKRAR